MTPRTTALRLVLVVLTLLSLVLPLSPATGERAFALLLYGTTALPDAFSPEAVSYVHLVHAVLGAVMAGWFATLLVLLRQSGLTGAVRTAALVGLGVWAVPDTAYSLVSGHWQNAVLNAAVLAVLLPPLLLPRPRHPAPAP